ncbi:uncharacterized protein EDB91DRAFT_1246521 [Suillus paluster]|uniref:uncharacterized protein n=1 Tax=Suillus paluster TaxID=48578 RepID=UPI001B86C1F8|nr:uncharacterized protein EDB91DRAFT_1246521 [Suillus paluster]KAG1745004.1 hypothetical protein EDB91DRAFT_1246521 [Suillus paluster]
MPRALLVSEIFSHIISYVGTHQISTLFISEIPVHRRDPTTLSRRTLSALALTCRAFTEQALDALWETMMHLTPLLRCAGIMLPMPREGHVREELQEDHCIIPTESQLAIINRYAHRIRFLTMTYASWQTHVEFFLQTLVCSSKVLLPNLRSLFVDCNHFCHLVPPLLGPRLRHLTINIKYHEKDEHYKGDEDVLPVFDMVIRSLPSSCPSLESFKVYANYSLGPWDVPTFALPLSHAIQNLHNLHSVVTPAITKDAMIHLGSLSSLTSFQTHLPTGSDLEDIFGSSRGPFLFENHESVDWVIKEWRDTEVFTRLWPHKLTTMTLRSDKITLGGGGPLQVLFDSLHTREAFRHLQRIHLLDSFHCKRTSADTAITIETIRPLFYLSHLQVVELNTKSRIDIDNDDLVEMAEAWPCLEVLSLNKDRGCSALNPVTLLGFVNFVDLCPRLKKLWITITWADAHEDVEDMESLLDLEGRRDSDLEYLKLDWAGEEKYEAWNWTSEVAVLLEKLFPRVVFG